VTSDDEEVVALFRREAISLRNSLIRMGASPELAEDCVNDAFLAVALKWPTLRATKPVAFAYTVAKHKLWREQRRARREVATEELDTEVDVPDGDPCDEFIRGEEAAAVRTALQRMPPGRKKEVLTYRYVKGLTIRETAAIMQISEGTVKNYAAEGLGVLRGLLEDETGEGKER
jgi:RNA polymerase sigma factor (sigma-70 family)